MKTKKVAFMVSLCIGAVAVGAAAFLFCSHALEERRYARARRRIRPVEVTYYPPECER